MGSHELPHRQEKDQEQGKTSFEISQKLLEQNPLIQTVTKIIADGVEKRASDILFEPLENGLQIRYRIDGIIYRHLLLPKALQDSVISRIKVMSGLDISEHRLPQDGRFKINFKDSDVDFRVSSIPSTMGERIALRVLDKTRVPLDINKLGFDSRTIYLFKRNLIKPFGMILVCGPTGCGKTTTLYSALKYINSIGKNIVTVEDPVEYQLYGMNQVAVNEDIGLTFANALRSILRQDPNIILVGEIRDFETADIAVKSALTGHILLSTLHTTTASGAIVRLINMGVEPFLIASSCLLIVSQVLLRILCPQCKESYRPAKAILEELSSYNLTPQEDIMLYNKKGCSECSNTGFKGRIAIAESIEITPIIKDLISAGASENQIRDAAIKEGMSSLRENGFHLLLEGITTMEEVLRVTSSLV